MSTESLKEDEKRTRFGQVLRGMHLAFELREMKTRFSSQLKLLVHDAWLR